MFIRVLFKYGTVGVEGDRDVRMTQYFLENLCRHTRLDTACGEGVSETVQIDLAVDRLIDDVVSFQRSTVIVVDLITDNQIAVT